MYKRLPLLLHVSYHHLHEVLHRCLRLLHEIARLLHEIEHLLLLSLCRPLRSSLHLSHLLLHSTPRSSPRGSRASALAI